MAVKVVLGTFFGDEGKGSTVQWLCKKAIAQGKKPIVVRFSGGPQSGHRVINDDIEHVCSSFGAGVLLNIPTYLTENVFVDLISLKKEYDVLVEKGFNPQIYVDYNCKVITPYDILMNWDDSKVLNDGSCGKGIYYTYKRSKLNASCILAYVMVYPEGYLKSVRTYYNIPDSEKNEEYENMFIKACKWFRDIHFSNSTGIKERLSEYNEIIFEGSQGLLLDMDCGFMPNCTPSKVGLNGIPEEFLEGAEVYLVMRTYLTRHGNGWTPVGEDLLRKNYLNLAEPTNKDDGTQCKFKIGAFDLKLFERALERHHFDNYIQRFGLRIFAVINHLDSLKREFYYTRDGHSVSMLSSKGIDGLIRFLKQEITSVSADVYIDRVYGSYRVNNIKLL